MYRKIFSVVVNRFKCLISIYFKLNFGKLRLTMHNFINGNEFSLVNVEPNDYLTVPTMLHC